MLDVGRNVEQVFKTEPSFELKKEKLKTEGTFRKQLAELKGKRDSLQYELEQVIRKSQSAVLDLKELEALAVEEKGETLYRQQEILVKAEAVLSELRAEKGQLEVALKQ